MVKLSKSKTIATFLVFSFILFYSPHLFAAKAANSGNLIGFIYAEDGLTPVENAVVKLKNITTSTLYESSSSNKQGIFKFQGIKEGLYTARVSTAEGDFSLNSVIGIRANQTAKISLSLKSQLAQEESDQGRKRKKIILGVFVLAISGAILYTFVKLTGKEAEASPFK